MEWLDRYLGPVSMKANQGKAQSGAASPLAKLLGQELRPDPGY